MAVIIELTLQEEANLVAEAKKKGLAPGAYARQLVTKYTSCKVCRTRMILVILADDPSRTLCAKLDFWRLMGLPTWRVILKSIWMASVSHINAGTPPRDTLRHWRYRCVA